MSEPDPSNLKRESLRLILEAWDAALAQGTPSEVIASTAIYAAFTDMVDLHGPEAVAQFAETLPSRIRSGEFTLGGETE